MRKSEPIISKNIRIRVPEAFDVGDHSIVDDYCYFSTKVKVGLCSHIANNCSVAGGKDFTFTLGDFSSVSAGVRIWCASDRFSDDLVAIFPEGFDESLVERVKGDVTCGNFTAVGSNSVVMPNNKIPEGTVIGALSFVPANFNFEPWSVYAGTPIKKVGERDKARVLKQASELHSFLKR